jgi:ABC-type glycerol-3-phosphate transport system substrate-binding protein
MNNREFRKRRSKLNTSYNLKSKPLLQKFIINIFRLISLSYADDFDLIYWHLGTYDEVIMLEPIAHDFYRQTGIRVKIQPIPWGNFQTKYLTAMASGDPPDIGTSNLAGGLDYGKVGGLLDLGEKFPEAVKRLQERIFPEMWPACYFRGHLFAIPYNSTALMGFYRKDIFQMLNLEPPQTWSDLVKVLEILTAHNYQYGFIWTRNTHWGIGTYIWPYDEELYVDNGCKVDWTAPGFVKGYKYAINLWNTYNLVIEKPVELFSIADPQKALPLFIDYDFRYSEILVRAPHLKHKFGVFPFPQADDGKPGTIMGGRTMVIFRDGRISKSIILWPVWESVHNLLYRLILISGMRICKCFLATNNYFMISIRV